MVYNCAEEMNTMRENWVKTLFASLLLSMAFSPYLHFSNAFQVSTFKCISFLRMPDKNIP